MLDPEEAKEQKAIIEDLAEELDVSDSKYKDAEAHYNAVGDWLNRDGSTLAQYNPTVHPQGSFALGTAIRPLNGEDYDV
ncbi:MAG: nucleotidyltransferase, partial [Acidobacteriota bacterium]